MQNSSMKKPSLKIDIGTRPSKGNLRFEGPLKVMVIDGKGEYWKTVWCAIGLGLSNVMIGAVNMTSLLYSVSVDDKHAVVCTLAYHFFMAEAILSLNYANGWSTPMRQRHRKLVHIFLMIIAIACAIIGTTKELLTMNTAMSAHGITGIVAGTLAGANILIGNFTLLQGHPFKTVHLGFGIPTFIMASVCLCLSYFTTSFRRWASTSVIVVLICFVIFYTTFIVATIIVRFFSRL